MSLIDISKLEFAECEQLAKQLAERMNDLRATAKAEMLERAERMGLELVPAKVRKPRRSKRAASDANGQTHVESTDTSVAFTTGEA